MPSIITETTSATKFDLAAIQHALRENKIDGWLFYDHHHRDPLAYSILGLDPDLHVTRRWYYFIPATGEPKKLVHRIESFRLDTLPGAKPPTPPGRSSNRNSKTLLTGATKSPCSTPPATPSCTSRWSTPAPSNSSAILGKEIVTSADLVSHFEAVLTDAQTRHALRRAKTHRRILDAAWKEIGTRVHATAAPTNTP